MKYKLITILFLSHSFSFASSKLQPREGEAACFSRTYTKSHMAAHRKQTLTAISVLVENKPADKAVEVPYQKVTVVGSRNGTLYANAAYCNYKADGSVDCQIECDGGAFQLRPDGEGATFEVARDYYFPLVTKDFNQEEDWDDKNKNGKMISLDYSQPEDRVYKLYSKPKAVCDEDWRRYQNLPEFGC